MSERLREAIEYVQSEYIDTEPGEPDWALSEVLQAAERATELERERDRCAHDYGQECEMRDEAETRAERAEEALLEARRRLRVNSIAWHTQFHKGDWETCKDSSCTNDHGVLGSLGPEWRPQEVARREARDG